MEIGETRVYKIRPSKRPACSLKTTNYYIKKDVEDKDYILYVGENNNFVIDSNVETDHIRRYKNQLGFSRCGDGNIHELWINQIPSDARNCGIAKAITFLCMIDRNVNPGPGLILGWEDHFTGYEKVIQLVRKHCMKIIKLDMTGEDQSAPHTYFSAAIMAGYTSFLVKRIQPENFDVFDTAEVQKGYNTHFLDVYEREWFFCKPKK